MSNPIQLDTNHGSFLGSQPDLASSSAQTGTFQGEKIIFEKDLLSKIIDGAEEAGRDAEDKIEEKKIDEREIESFDSNKLMAVDEIVQYLQDAKKEKDIQEMVQLVKQMLQGQGQPGQLAQQQFKNDVTSQYLALQYALSEGENTNAPPEILDSIREAIEQLQKKANPKIRASLNTIAAAAKFGKTEEGIEQFQQTYQDVALGTATLSKTLNLLIERFSKNFEKGLQSMMQALGQDLSSSEPSIDKNKLDTLLKELKYLKVTTTALESGKNLARALKERHAFALDAITLLQKLVSSSEETWLYGDYFSQIADKLGTKKLVEKIELLHGSKKILSELPTEIFSSPDNRNSVLDAIQKDLDEVNAKEEEEEDTPASSKKSK